MNAKEINVLVLAYMGDTIYEKYIREFLINKKIPNVNELQKHSVEYVSAKAQAKFLTELVDKNILNNEEISVIKRARNNKGGKHPKNCDILTYKHATALEALIGYLYFENKQDRIDEIMKIILEEKGNIIW